eukprot:TRINITY_DN1416_c0_g1_i7.p1 TRINITY_DN1416_c0_g1~~TRINITY_DN1416_c0_g1_i7.p1  ORF type:complete len:801 (+),score=218.27 TRINITY_DN1416_c0_g1_i7:736-3138(+)
MIFRLYKSPAEVLFGFDIDSCTVGYDGENVWMMERGRRALTKGYNLVNMSRRSLTYEQRLFKYSKRGFCVAVPNLDKARVNPYIFNKTLRETQGLSKLLLYDHKAQSLSSPSSAPKRKGTELEDSDYSELTIPWGPGWYTASIMAMLNLRDKTQFFARRKTNSKETSEGPQKHKHIFITGIDEAIGGSSSFWCKVCQRRLYLDDADESGKFVKRPIEWVKRNPAYQDYDNGFRRSLMTGSFYPVVDENWEKGVYDASEESVTSQFSFHKKNTIAKKAPEKTRPIPKPKTVPRTKLTSTKPTLKSRAKKKFVEESLFEEDSVPKKDVKYSSDEENVPKKKVKISSFEEDIPKKRAKTSSSGFSLNFGTASVFGGQLGTGSNALGSQLGTSSNVIGGQLGNGSNLFGNQSNASNFFGTALNTGSTSSLFGGQSGTGSNVLGTAINTGTTSSLFGGQLNTDTTSSVFGGQLGTGSNALGSQLGTSPNVIGGQLGTHSSLSFGGQLGTGSPSAFGGPTSFSSSPGIAAFGGPASNIFSPDNTLKVKQEIAPMAKEDSPSKPVAGKVETTSYPFFKPPEETIKLAAPKVNPSPEKGTFECTVCSKLFYSENQKRKHVRETGHLQPITSSVPGGGFFIADSSGNQSLAMLGPQPGAAALSFASPVQPRKEDSPAKAPWHSVTEPEVNFPKPSSPTYSGFQQSSPSKFAPKLQIGPQPSSAPLNTGKTVSEPAPKPRGDQPARPTTRMLLLVALCFKEGAISAEEKGKLKDMIFSGNEYVYSAVEVFDIDQDLDELVDTFKRICKFS